MGRQTLCGPQPAKITVVSLFVFNRLFPHNWGGLFRSAFWFVWWNLQEIYHGFDKSRTMWVFQHKLFFFWKFLKPSGGSQLGRRLGDQAGKVLKIQADRPIQIPWCEDHQEVKTPEFLVLSERIFHRKYHLLSRERVQPFIDAEEKVNQLPGVSKIHQAFSTGER